MNNKRPPAKKISGTPVVKDWRRDLKKVGSSLRARRRSFMGIVRYTGTVICQAIDGSEIGGFLMAFGLLGAVAAAALRTVAANKLANPMDLVHDLIS